MNQRFFLFLRSEQAFFVVLPLLFLLLVPFVVAADPSLHRVNFIADLHLIGELRSPIALLGIMGAFLSFFFYSPLKELAAAGGKDRARIITAICFALGFGNLLFGVISSFVGILLFFVLGLLIPFVSGIRASQRPAFSPRLFLIATALFVGFGAITLLYSPVPSLSVEMFRRELWFFLIPLLFSFYPPDSRTIKYFSRMVMPLGYIYMLLVGLLYVQFCLSSGNSLLSAFGFNKLYFMNPNAWPVTPHHLLRVFGFEHYTYLLFALSAPFVHALFKNRYPLRVCCYGLVLLVYIFIIQSRIWLLLFVFLIVGAVALRFFTRRALITSIIVLAVLIAGILAVPKTRSFFNDPIRSELLSIASVESKDTFWKGRGLGTSQGILSKYDREEFGHFHNEFVQTFVETGVLGSILLLFIPVAYAVEAFRRRNNPAVLLLLAFVVLMFVEDVIYQTHYFMATLVILSLYIQLHDEKSLPQISQK